MLLGNGPASTITARNYTHSLNDKCGSGVGGSILTTLVRRRNNLEIPSSFFKTVTVPPHVMSSSASTRLLDALHMLLGCHFSHTFCVMQLFAYILPSLSLLFGITTDTVAFQVFIILAIYPKYCKY